VDEELRRRGNKGSSKRKTKSLDFIGSSKIIEKLHFSIYWRDKC
jgi:hypothetical protein